MLADKCKLKCRYLLRIYYAMRPSPLRHPLAVLRQIIGISQGELAVLVGKSRATIQAVELRKLNLSEELGLKIALETGVSARWLLDGDPAVAPWVDSLLGPQKFSKETFERRRANRADAESEEILHRLVFPEITAARFIAIYEAALEHPDRNLATYRTEKFLQALEKEFGISKERLDTELRKQELWKDLEPPAERFKKWMVKHPGKEPQAEAFWPLLRWVARAIAVISPQPDPTKKKSSESSPSRP